MSDLVEETFYTWNPPAYETPQTPDFGLGMALSLQHHVPYHAYSNIGWSSLPVLSVPALDLKPRGTTS